MNRSRPTGEANSTAIVGRERSQTSRRGHSENCWSGHETCRRRGVVPQRPLRSPVHRTVRHRKYPNWIDNPRSCFSPAQGKGAHRRHNGREPARFRSGGECRASAGLRHRRPAGAHTQSMDRTAGVKIMIGSATAVGRVHRTRRSREDVKLGKPSQPGIRGETRKLFLFRVVWRVSRAFSKDLT